MEPIRGRLRTGRWRAVLLLAVPLALSGCGSDTPAPPTTFAPLNYAYLRPLRLNVGSVEIGDAPPPAVAPGDLAGSSPAIPGDALNEMARDRLVAAGASGRAVFSVEQGSILPHGDDLDGLMKVKVDLYTSDGQRAAFAEAAVARSSTAPESDAAMPAALYELTRQMMSDMNVEFEFQLRRSLGDWLQAGDGPAPPPVPVRQEALPPPGASGGASGPAAGGAKFRLIPVTPTSPP